MTPMISNFFFFSVTCYMFTGCSLQQCRKMLKIGAIGATAFLLTQDFWIAISDLSPVHHSFSLYDLLLSTSTFKAQNLSYKKRWQIVLVTVCMCILHKNNLQWLLIQQDPALGACHFGVRWMTEVTVVYFLISPHYKEEVITSGESLTKYQTFTFITNSCDKAVRMTNWLHQLLTVVVDKHIIICQKFQANHYSIHNLCQPWCWLALKRHS